MKRDLARDMRVARAHTGKTQREMAGILAKRYPQLAQASWHSVISYIERGWVDKALSELVGKGEQA